MAKDPNLAYQQLEGELKEDKVKIEIEDGTQESAIRIDFQKDDKQ
jgi:hypothetical protein